MEVGKGTSGLTSEVENAVENCMAAHHDDEPTRVQPEDEKPKGPTSPNWLNPGAIVGRYRICHEIGRGGQGWVFLAEDLELNRKVAVKTVSAMPSQRDEWLRRFRYEARALARVQHPNIVQVHEAFEEQGMPFFAMEYVEGKSLNDVMEERSLDRRDFIKLIAKVADAIGFAHRQGIVHRDVKPQNILFNGDWEPKVTDFGLATSWHDDTQFGVTTTDGRVMGSPAYMAPEQARGRRSLIGPQTDVYALGTILYYGLTRQLPFYAENPMELLMHIVHDEAEPPVSLDPTIGQDLSAICLKAMEKDPRDRYQSADEMAEDLRRYLNDEPILACPASLANRFVKALRRNRELAVLSGIALAFMVLALGVSIGLFTRQSAATANESLRTELRSVANTAAIMFSEKDIAEIQSPEDADKPIYQDVVTRLNKIRARNLRIRNAYLLKRVDGGNGFAFVADADAFLKDGARGSSRDPGDPFLPGPDSAASEALVKPTADPEPVQKKWGNMLSGYAPVLRNDGTPVAVLGLDIRAEDVRELMQPVLRTTAQVSGLAAILFMGLTVTVCVRVMRRRRFRPAREQPTQAFQLP